MINWQNVAPNPHLNNLGTATANYSSIPIFGNNYTITPGIAPQVPGTTAPKPVDLIKFFANFPSLVKILG